MQPLFFPLLASALLLQEGGDVAVVSVYDVPDTSVRLALVDLDDDRALDLVTVVEDGLTVHCLGPDRTFPGTPTARLPWGSPSIAWTFAEEPGSPARVAVIEGGDSLVFHTLREGGFAPVGEALEVRTDLPRGRFHMNFMRDVNSDGRLDLVLPAGGTYALHLATAEGFAAPLEVRLEADVDYDFGDPDAIDASFGQEVDIPWFELRDIDGDGDQDLVAETTDRVYFHLADPELAGTPTWILDLETLRDEIPERRGIALDDVFSNIPGRVEWRVLDLDGEGALDLLVQVGGKFRTYLGGSVTGPVERPSQLLKTSGNVLYFFVDDLDGDARPDLRLLRGEKLSIARILRWLILPGQLDFDLFTYRNVGGSFELRPSQRQKVRLEFPRLMKLMDEIEEFEEKLGEADYVPARRLALGEDGERNDVVDVVGGDLLLFRDRALPEEEAEVDSEDGEDLLKAFLLSDMETLEDGGTKTIDLSDFDQWVTAAGGGLREALGDATPDLRVPLGVTFFEPTVHPMDLDGDGRMDFFVVGEDGEGLLRVAFVVQRP